MPFGPFDILLIVIALVLMFGLYRLPRMVRSIWGPRKGPKKAVPDNAGGSVPEG